MSSSNPRWSVRARRWWWQLVAEPALVFCWPSRCFACGGRLDRHQHLGACLGCWSALTPLVPPLCGGCGLPRAASDLLGPARDRCARCCLWPGVPEIVRPAVLYDDHARRFLLRAKLGGAQELLPVLGRQLARALSPDVLGSRPVAVVPVPSHPWMNLRRGFRPADEVARGLGRALGLRLRAGTLVLAWASRPTAKRLGVGPRRRRAYRSFRVRRVPREPVVLLVDDVMTTGATIDACARALRHAGVSRILAAVWARRV